MRVKEDKVYEFDDGYVVQAIYNEIIGGYVCYIIKDEELLVVATTTYKTMPKRIAKQVLVSEIWALDL